MVLVNFFGFFGVTPNWIRHAKGDGFTFADLVAPLFLFALGLLYRKSLISRIKNDSRQSAYFHVARRYTLLLVIGLLGGAIGKLRITLDWGILQSIGLAGLIALPFIELGKYYRMLLGISLLILYWFFIPSAIINSTVALAEHGGPIATISWASLILFSTVAGELFDSSTLEKGAKNVFLYALFLGGIGLLLSFVIPINKTVVSPSYVLISTSLSAVIFLAFVVLVDKFDKSIPTMETLGRNALVVFLLHYLLVKIGHTVLDGSSSLVIVIFGAAVVYVACYLLALFLQNKGLVLKL